MDERSGDVEGDAMTVLQPSVTECVAANIIVMLRVLLTPEFIGEKQTSSTAEALAREIGLDPRFFGELLEWPRDKRMLLAAHIFNKYSSWFVKLAKESEAHCQMIWGLSPLICAVRDGVDPPVVDLNDD